ncbi:MAG: hypothetical protein JRN52_12145, partial [Nitrososphaerota archaeon]|nr:hypothetical protein [Nitrososphaerota archaeon]
GKTGWRRLRWISSVMLKCAIREYASVLGIATSIFGLFAAIVDFILRGVTLTQIGIIFSAAWYLTLAYNFWSM